LTCAEASRGSVAPNGYKLPVLKEIHTSPSRKAIPPIVWVFLRPILNISVIVFGKLFKKWWKKQPPESKREFWSKLRRNKYTIIGKFPLSNMQAAFL